MRKHALLLGWMPLAMLFAGCATVMQPVSKTAEAYPPADNEATIIFLRSAVFRGCGNKPPVFDVTGEETKFLGIVACGTQVAYKTTAGEHLFMIAKRNAEFLRANLGGGKTYYVMVNSWPGWGGSRFTLNPAQKQEQNQENFQTSKNTARFVENTPESYAWADKNAAHFQKKRDEYMPRWIEKYGTDTYGLAPEDGM